LKLEDDLLSLIEGHPRALNRADVHKHIFAAVFRLDESIFLLAVEPLHSSFSLPHHSERKIQCGFSLPIRP
jgi:hypothetical protein